MRSYLFLLLWTLGSVLCPSAHILAQAGQLDASFGNGGWVHSDFGGKEQGGTIAVQEDGKLLVGGRIALSTAAYDFMLVRYLANGQLDSSFGTNGLITWDFGSDLENLEFVRQLPNGKIFAGGFSGANPNTTGVLILLLPDGSVDPEFGVNGIVKYKGGKSTGPVAAAVQSDGKFVVTGVCVVDSSDIDWNVARFLPDGNMDTSFNHKGWMYHNFLTREDIPFDIMVEPDGKILVSGCAGVYPKANFSFLRLLPDGSKDPGYGTDGSLQTDFGNNHDIAYTSILTPERKYLVSGTVRDSITNYNFALARYHYDGTLDTDFGGTGKLTYDFKGPIDYGLYMIRQPDDKYLVCGENNVLTHNRYVVARFDKDGNLDAGFGRSGLAEFDAVNILTDQTPHFAMQKDGRIVMTANYKDGNNVDLLVIRWTNDLVSNTIHPVPMKPFVFLHSNPVRDRARFQMDEEFGDFPVYCNLMDINGKVLKSWEIKSHSDASAELDCSILSTGLYFVRCKSASREMVLPLSKF